MDLTLAESESRAIERDNATLRAQNQRLVEVGEMLLKADEVGEADCQRHGVPRLIERHSIAQRAIAAARKETP